MTVTRSLAVDLETEQARIDVLDLPEWYQPMSNSAGSCPWCENMEHWGHADDCPRATVLAILEAALREDAVTPEGAPA